MSRKQTVHCRRSSGSVREGGLGLILSLIAAVAIAVVWVLGIVAILVANIILGVMTLVVAGVLRLERLAVGFILVAGIWW